MRLCVWFILGMRFPGVGRAARLFLGVGCAWFPDSCSRWFLVVFAEGFPGVFVSARRFLALVGGVSGWVGVVFSPAVLPGPGLFRVRVLVLFGEFDPGSGRTLATCLTLTQIMALPQGLIPYPGGHTRGLLLYR